MDPNENILGVKKEETEWSVVFCRDRINNETLR